MPFLKSSYMPKNFLRSLFILFALIAQLVISTPLARAQESKVAQQGNGMQISPAVRTFTLDPGETTKYELRLTNITDKPISASSLVSDFEQKDGEEGIPILLLGNRESLFSLKGYIADLGTVELKPKEQKVLSVSVTVPTNASPGAHYGAIRFLSSNDGGSGETVVNLAAGIGVLLFINVTGNVHDNLSLLQVSAAKNDKTGGIFDSGPLSLVTRVKNNGNTFLKPFGKIIVKDWRGKTIEEKDLNAEKSKLVLPGTARRLEDNLNSKTKYLGRYKAEINMSYGDGGEILIGTTTFWVLPWKQVLVGLVVLAIIIFVIIKMLLNYKRQILKEANGGHRKR